MTLGQNRATLLIQQVDQRVGVEIDFWKQYASEGITDEVAKSAAKKFRDVFEELDNALGDQEFLLADGFSVLDIAWFIYANRLILTGYPIGRLHPKLGVWYDRLVNISEIAAEVVSPPPVKNSLMLREYSILRTESA